MKNLKLINYEVTFDPLKSGYEFSGEERQFAQKSHDVLAYGEKITPGYVKSLVNAIAKYPLNPSLKNYLATAYKLSGDKESLVQIAHQTIEAHPDYFFGKAVLAELYMKDEEFEKAAALMENFSDIGVMYPDRKVFHVSEVKMFNSLAVEYFALLGDSQQMETRLGILKKVMDRDEFKKISQRFQMLSLSANLKKMQERQKAVKTIEGNFRAKNTQTTEMPIFQNALIEELYHQDLSISEGLITAILALPKESLIDDLEKVLQDALNRYEFIREGSEGGIAEESFATHAIMLLGELKAYKSFPQILDFLKQGSEFVEFWLMDVMGALLLRTLYELGKAELSQLEAFLKEPDVFWMCKTTVSNVLKNIAELEPLKTEEITKIFANVLDFYWDNQNNESICDHTVISSLAADVAQLQISTLHDSMKRFYDAKLVDVNMNGDWAELMEMYEYPATPIVSEVPSLLESYRQFSSGKFPYDYVRYETHPVVRKKFEQLTSKALESDAFKLLSGSYDDDDDDEYYDEDRFFQPTRPIVLAKIDRNAKVNVRYSDGKEVKDVKYKKVEDDVVSGKCRIV